MDPDGGVVRMADLRPALGLVVSHDLDHSHGRGDRPGERMDRAVLVGHPQLDAVRSRRSIGVGRRRARTARAVAERPRVVDDGALTVNGSGPVERACQAVARAAPQRARAGVGREDDRPRGGRTHGVVSCGGDAAVAALPGHRGLDEQTDHPPGAGVGRTAASRDSGRRRPRRRSVGLPGPEREGQVLAWALTLRGGHRRPGVVHHGGGRADRRAAETAVRRHDHRRLQLAPQLDRHPATGVARGCHLGPHGRAHGQRARHPQGLPPRHSSRLADRRARRCGDVQHQAVTLHHLSGDGHPGCRAVAGHRCRRDVGRLRCRRRRLRRHGHRHQRSNKEEQGQDDRLAHAVSQFVCGHRPRQSALDEPDLSARPTHLPDFGGANPRAPYGPDVERCAL